MPLTLLWHQFPFTSRAVAYCLGISSQIEDDEAFSKCEALVDKLLALGDVDSVHTNVVGLD
eukprot:scaffold2590_cov14-Tisochrysis_lutea.AAC.1